MPHPKWSVEKEAWVLNLMQPHVMPLLATAWTMNCLIEQSMQKTATVARKVALMTKSLHCPPLGLREKGLYYSKRKAIL